MIVQTAVVELVADAAQDRAQCADVHHDVMRIETFRTYFEINGVRSAMEPLRGSEVGIRKAVRDHHVIRNANGEHGSRIHEDGTRRSVRIAIERRVELGRTIERNRRGKQTIESALGQQLDDNVEATLDRKTLS